MIRISENLLKEKYKKTREDNPSLVLLPEEIGIMDFAVHADTDNPRMVDAEAEAEHISV